MICISLARIQQGDYELNMNIFMFVKQKWALLYIHCVCTKLGTLPPVPDCHHTISKQEELKVLRSFKKTS